MGKLKNLLILCAIIGVILALFWFAKRFGSGENVQSEKPLIICQPQDALPDQQKCFWTAHIHAHMQVFRGSTEIPVGFEQGELEKSHTHTEQNKIHWHGLIPVDPNTKEVKDWSLFKIENLPRDLKLSLEGQPKFIVNSKGVNPSYIWQDGDHVEIHYESR